MCEVVLWAFASRAIGSRAPKKLPKVISLLTRIPVRIVGEVVIFFLLYKIVGSMMDN